MEKHSFVHLSQSNILCSRHQSISINSAWYEKAEGSSPDAGHEWISKVYEALIPSVYKGMEFSLKKKKFRFCLSEGAKVTIIKRLNPKTLQYSLNIFSTRPCSIWTSIYNEVTKSEITKDYIMLSVWFGDTLLPSCHCKNMDRDIHLNVESPLTVEL